jgi:Tol biopolymer transport system component
VISKKTPASKDYDFHHPDISPDGKYIAFSVAKEGGFNNNTIWIQDIASGETWPVTEKDTTVSTGDVCVQWSPDGKRLAFGSDRGGEIHIYVVDIDGSNLGQITTEPVSPGVGWYGIPSWSSTGDKLVYASKNNDETGSTIQMYDFQNKTAVILHNYPNRVVWAPALSPDGKYVVYEAGIELEILNLSTGLFKVLPSDVSSPKMPKWSPTGEWIGFQAMGPWRTYILPSTGGTAIKVGPGNDYWSQVPSWTSDGKQIVYHGKRIDRVSVVVRDENSGEEWEASHGDFINDWYWATWSKNEEKVAVIVDDLVKEPPHTRLSVVDLVQRTSIDTPILQSSMPQWWSNTPNWLSGSNYFIGVVQQGQYIQLSKTFSDDLTVELLTDTPSIKFATELSSDEEMVAYISDESGSQDIWIYDQVTSENYQLTFSERPKWELRFSPSGDRLLFSQNNGSSQGDIMLVNVTSGEVTTLTSDGGWELNPEWIDPSTISYTKHPGGLLAIHHLDTEEINILEGHDRIFTPNWHSSKKSILYSTNDGDIIQLDIESRQASTYLTGGALKAVQSPSGRRTVYLKRTNNTTHHEIWIESVEDIIAGVQLP